MSDLSGNQERNSFLDGQIAQLMGDYLTRLQRYEEAREEYQEAGAAYQRISTTSPDFESARTNQAVVLEKLHRLPQRQRSGEDFRLEKLFAVRGEEQPGEVAVKSRVNLSQWLQNMVGESWQTIEQLFAPAEPSFAYVYALREHRPSPDAKTVSDLVETIYSSQDEHLLRQAALRLGEMGTSNSEVLAALKHLLEVTRDEETRWSAAESLWHLDPNNSVGGIRRVKDLGMLIGQHPVALMVAVLPKIDGTRAVLLRVYPLGKNQKYLPPHLELVVLDGAENTFLETGAREADNYIQLKFSGSPGEQFGVRVGLGEAKLTEDFIL